MSPATIVTFLAELIETHMEKCGEIDHIISEVTKSGANIIEIENPKPNKLRLNLNDGTMVYIDVSVL